MFYPTHGLWTIWTQTCASSHTFLDCVFFNHVVFWSSPESCYNSLYFLYERRIFAGPLEWTERGWNSTWFLSCPCNWTNSREIGNMQFLLQAGVPHTMETFSSILGTWCKLCEWHRRPLAIICLNPPNKRSWQHSRMMIWVDWSAV